MIEVKTSSNVIFKPTSVEPIYDNGTLFMLRNINGTTSIVMLLESDNDYPGLFNLATGDCEYVFDDCTVTPSMMITYAGTGWMKLEGKVSITIEVEN